MPMHTSLDACMYIHATKFSLKTWQQQASYWFNLLMPAAKSSRDDQPASFETAFLCQGKAADRQMMRAWGIIQL
jgi:hypothetical protein